MTSLPNLEALEQTRHNHIGRLLLRASRAYNALALTKLHARGHTTLSLAHTNLLPHLEVGGTRIVTLAERAGMTKQAAGQLVAQLEQHGYVTRRPDPQDGRATRIYFTEAGRRFLHDARELKGDIESEYRTLLGESGWTALNTALERLLESTQDPHTSHLTPHT